MRANQRVRLDAGKLESMSVWLARLRTRRIGDEYQLAARLTLAARGTERWAGTRMRSLGERGYARGRGVPS
jgi:hypothetical protein